MSCKVRRQAICAALADHELTDLETIMTHRIVDRGQALVYEGDPPAFAYNIIDGGLKLYKSLADGRIQVTAFLLPGDFLGISSRSPLPFTAEALTRTEVCAFPYPKLEVVFEKYSALEERFLTEVSDEVAAVQDHMLLLGRKTASERLASFLIWLAGKYEGVAPPTVPLALLATRADIADYLGLTLETVSRTFSQFKRQGFIELPHATEVVLRNRERLEEIATGA